MVDDKPLFMNAYYYSFKPTGIREIDLILSALATAGKAHHYTDGWYEATGYEDPNFRGETYIDWIQNAANDAAELIKEHQGG